MAHASLQENMHLISHYCGDSISLHENMIFLQLYLEESPDEAGILGERTREIINVAKDIIEHMLSDSLKNSAAGSSESELIRPPEGKYEPRYDSDEIQRVTEEIESIANRVKGRHRESVRGLNVDLMEIISRIGGGSFWLEIIPIVGRRGIGKTSLARDAYNHPLVVDCFEIRVWVTAKGSWSEILSDLLRSMNRSIFAERGEDGLCRRVRKSLEFKRYLIVLDDVSSVEAFDKIRFMLPDDRNGSRVLVTTRHPGVASNISSYSRIHEMRVMNLNQSWNLLRRRVFEQDPCPRRLELFGKMIARSCRGLPLALELVSGILAADHTRAAWENVAENIKAASSFGDDEHLSHILNLSYTCLPSYLKPCLLYMAVLPEDWPIRTSSRHNRIWVAEGFLNQIGSDKILEETAKEYLEELVKRSLVSVKRKSSGGIKSVHVHDLFRDLEVTVYSHGNFNRMASSEGIGEGIELSSPDYSLLRVLDFSNAYDLFDEYDLPHEIYELFHLRYLAFDCEFSIGEAISNLENLQTLVIRPRKRTRELVELPVGIWRMPQLRHLEVFSHVLPITEEANALENLETLAEAVDFICSEQTLGLIPNLEKLGIFYTEWIGLEQDYQLHNLVFLKKLKILKIATHNFLRKQSNISLAFPTTLEKLTLSGLGLAWEDVGIVASLPNLRVLKMRDHACIGNTWETNEGGFPRLKFLLIHESELQHWATRASHFPRLERLILLGCKRMREVPEDLGGIPTLELIEVDHWNKLLVDSAKRIQEDQLSLGNHLLRVHAV